jgi:hypothetical protein
VFKLFVCGLTQPFGARQRLRDINQMIQQPLTLSGVATDKAKVLADTFQMFESGLFVLRVRLRSLHVATWCVAHTPFRVCCRRAPRQEHRIADLGRQVSTDGLAPSCRAYLRIERAGLDMGIHKA